jgi:hypothetical protein
VKPSNPDFTFGDEAAQNSYRKRWLRRALIVRRHRRLMLEELRALEGAVEE